MPKPHPWVIALTGGIASGKSTVADFFSELGIPIIDADQISRELVKSGSVILDKIIKHFGKEFLTTEAHQNNKNNSNTLNRAKLRKRIFNFPADKKWLENLLHPEIYSIIQKRVKVESTKAIPYIICVIPLYFETQNSDKKPDFIDKIFVLDTEETRQIQRLIQRDHITQSEAKTILKSQSSRETRVKNANEIILNNQDTASLKAQILVLDKKYRTSFSQRD